MIVLPEVVMKDLMTQIVNATHCLTDTGGTPQVMSTIAEAQLRVAAIVALQIATGQTIWPGDRQIVIQRPKLSSGIFREEN